ncbi:hypothetical protein OROMI_020601 [Orobanche minor]
MAGLAEEPAPELPRYVKQKCWVKAAKIKGRNPKRWCRDPLGNVVFHKLHGCHGSLCYAYDHVIPILRQLLIDPRESKGNQTDMSESKLIENSAYYQVKGRDMDFLEMAVYVAMGWTP